MLPLILDMHVFISFAKAILSEFRFPQAIVFLWVPSNTPFEMLVEMDVLKNHAR